MHTANPHPCAFAYALIPIRGEVRPQISFPTLTPMKITQERLKSKLLYDESTGVFRWKDRAASHVPPGSIAGTKTDKGYVSITLDGNRHRAHRLAWLYVYGVLPEWELDHEDRNRANNAILNLRPSSRPEQMRNVAKVASGAVSVNGRWVAKIRHMGERIYLGCFGTRIEAETAYRQKLNEILG